MKMQSEITGSGAPLVLVPGGLTGWLSWLPFAERLAPSRKVVRLQLLSVQLGLEGKFLPAGYSPATEREALAETLETLDVVRPSDFAAWSYGAEIALEFALDHPDSVRSLTLIEPGGFWVLPTLDAETKRQREEDRRLPRENLSDDDLEQVLHVAALVPPETNPRELPQWPLWVQHRQSLRAVPFIADYQGDRRRLPKLTTPTLLVKGTGGDPLAHKVIEELARRLPNAQMAEWPGGHTPHIVSMEPFLERMAAFQASAD
jgi:pimeloyl-ACP methyl ester carboxylesterase